MTPGGWGIGIIGAGVLDGGGHGAPGTQPEKRYCQLEPVLRWRAVDQDGDVIDILAQRYRNARAATRFFRKLLKGQGTAPWRLVTDKLRSYSAAHREVMSSVTHDTQQHANNRPEVSHQPTRQ